MSDTTYNGWTNYETWLVKLWQDNDQCSCDFWQEQAAECVRMYADLATIRLADGMKAHYENRSYDLAGVTGFWADLMGAAIAAVNWREIAEHWIDAVRVVDAAIAAPKFN